MSKQIHIIGGMGPQASAFLLQRMIALAPEVLGAKDGGDFPHIVLHSLPVPDFISSEKNIPVATKLIKETVASIPRGAVIGMACNTAHLLVEEVGLSARKQFVHLPDAVVSEVNKQGITHIGLLASPTTLKSGLYTQRFADAGIQVIEPKKIQAADLERVIRKAIAGTASQAESEMIATHAHTLQKQGAQKVLLGCTELPLVVKTDEGLISSVDVLARELLSRASVLSPSS